MGELNLNMRAMRVADELAARAAELGVSVQTIGGTRYIDAGVAQPGGFGAGLLVARTCMADLGSVALVPARIKNIPLPAVTVTCDKPLAGCMASQYAGWQIKVGKYFAMGSGPMRAAYGKEELFNDIGLREKSSVAVGVLETSEAPTAEVVQYISEKTGVLPTHLTLIAARTASLAGGVQVVARSVETALHKLHTLRFDLSRVVAGFGSATLPPVAKNDLAAIGRTNDAVLYGGEVTLCVTGDDESLAQIGTKLPSCASSDYGEPFKQIFKRYEYDFYKIDPLLFSPAVVSLQNVQTGKVQTFGKVNENVLADSFFG